MKTIYLDNSATTKPSAAVIAAMTDALKNGWDHPAAPEIGTTRRRCTARPWMRRKPSRMRVKSA